MSAGYGDKEDLGSTLMRVIRTLSESHSSEQREEEKLKLKQQFHKSDKQLDGLVSTHHKDLTLVMQLYAKVNNRLCTSRVKIKEIKSNLNACKQLLHYKRDELKKLWLDGVEQKRILELLEKIERLKESPEKISHLLSKHENLEATQVLMQASDHIDELQNVEGLCEVKELLDNKKEKLYGTLLEDLTRQLYVETTWGVLKSVQRKGEPLKSSGSDRSSSGRAKGRSNPQQLRRQHLSSKYDGRSLPPESEDDFWRILNDPKLADGKDGPQHVVVINVECLARMNKLSDAVDVFRSEFKSEFQNIVAKSTQALIDSSPCGGDVRLLSELFSLVVNQFTLVVDGFRIFSEASQKSMQRNQCTDPVRFDHAEVWAQAQAAMETMLTDYLDFKSSKSGTTAAGQNATSSNFTDPSTTYTADINSYFGKRKTQKPKRDSLFRFDYSSTALSMNNYLKEQDAYSKEKVLVCEPNPHNITPIYGALMDFVKVIEAALRCDPGTHCTLYSFLVDYIKHVFLGEIHVDVGSALTSSADSMNAWSCITDPDVLHELKASRPLLMSTVEVQKSIDELTRYMRSLPLYSSDFLTMICNMAMQYKGICMSGYGTVVEPTKDKRVISAQWAKDEDISRLLKSLPNWQAIAAPPSADSLSESPQDVERRNAQETAMLNKNLGDARIQLQEMLRDPNQLKSLAQLQESLDWFSKNLLALARDFRTSSLKTFGDLPKLNENSIQTLISLGKEFEDLSATCLLVLHLEVRVHCFHYLHSIWRGPTGAQFFGGPDSTDPNDEVLKLTRDLVQIEDGLTSSLQERKTRYVFEGVPHLISTIFVATAEHIRKINCNGVKKMCRNIFAVQQTLTSAITGGNRETSLDHAKLYFELFNQRPQEVIDSIVEKGPAFTHEEYVNALNLLHRSDAALTEQTKKLHVHKLGETMKQVGIRV